MRQRIVMMIVLMAIVAGIVIVMVIQKPTPINSLQIHMTSDPFPSAVGNERFSISLTNADGTPVSGASVRASANMMMDGMLPLQGRPAKSTNGSYPVDIIWPMPGEWTVDVTATLPDHTITKDSFDLYVYPVPPLRVGGATTYWSIKDIKAKLSANPAHEYWIVIPQGTQALQRSGQGEDLIPAQIHLSLSGQNILIIRNDDIADQTVGPFFVRAGETVRQEFTQEAVFQGKCTIRHGAEVSIVVD